MQTLEQLNNYQLIDTPLKIEEIKILTGANYFSGEQVVRFRLNLGEFNEVFTNKIPEFFEKLKAKLPSLHEHFCSVGEIGGFFLRMQEGTLLGHVMEHVAIEIQTLAGMKVGFGKTRETKIEGVYNVVFRFLDEYAGIYAGKIALNLLNSILNGADFDIDEHIKNLIFIREKRLLGPSTQAIVNEAERKKIPVLRLDKLNQVQLGTGKYRRLIRATISANTSLIAVETSDDKYLTTKILQEAGIPTPQTIITEDINEIIEFHKKIKSPIVIKPAYGYQGKGVFLELDDNECITKAFNWAKELDDEVIAQEDIKGGTYRLLVVDFKFVAAVRLVPAYVVGDGELSVNELVIKLNSQFGREEGDKGKLSKVEIEEDSLKILELKNYTIETILPLGEVLYLKNSGNMRLGASSIDMTDNIPSNTIFIAERIAKILNIDVVGIDVLSPNIKQPLNENNAKIIEVNAAPDFRMHTNPTVGIARHVQRDFISMLFPKNAKTEIPIYSITGSQGKSLTASIINKGLKNKGLQTGVVNKTGFYVADNCIFDKDATLDSKYAKLMLQEASIDCAILETPVEQILNSGLGYSFADFGIVLNLDEKEEYYEYDHIRNLEDISYAKSVIAEQVKDSGYTILNANYDFILDMQDRLYNNVVLFSENQTNKSLRWHIKNNGIAVTIENKHIVIYENMLNITVISVDKIPFLTKFNQNFNKHSILASVAALYLSDINISDIKNLLMSI